VNSLHQQGVRELGKDLRVCAVDASGIVQAIESTDRAAPFVLGVQWHPEYLLAHRSHRRLFGELVRAARRM
jgi:putative glutamine amidotransferase